MENTIAIIGSFIYIFLVIAASSIVAKKTKNEELSRKLVHILVGNWVFFIPLFTNLWAKLLVPTAFVFLNYLSVKKDIFKGMEREEKNFGTVYYAISIFVLTLLSHFTGFLIIPYAGVLTMAYADGFAALVGKKYGEKNKWRGSEKSIPGSLTVFLISFIIAFLTIYNFGVSIKIISILETAFISLIVAVYAVLVEFNGVDGLDNLTLPIGTALFTTLLMYLASRDLYMYLFIALLILVFAYRHKSITLDGALMAILVALVLFVLGSSRLGYALLTFFILGSIVSKVKNQEKEKADSLQNDNGARNWKQVVCNSLPAFAICIYSWLTNNHVFDVAAFITFTAAGSDTFASEIGKMTKGKVYNIITWKKIPSGLSGGVSKLGFIASILGSLFLSLFAYHGYEFSGVFFTFVFGILGSVIDSLLGATIQRKYRTKEGLLIDEKKSEDDKLESGLSFVTNNTVNILSISIATFLALGLIVYLS